MAEETTATLEADNATDVETQPLDKEQQPTEESGQAQEQAIESDPDQRPEQFNSDYEWAASVEKEFDDPNHRKFSEKEMDLLQDYLAGNLEKSSRTEPAKKEAEPEEKPEAKAEEKTEEKADEKPESEIDQDTVNQSSSLDLSIMREVGAKNKSEVIEKIKGLRKAVSGKLDAAPEFAKVKSELQTMQQLVQSEKTLWADLKKGEPRAIQYAKKWYGLDVSNGIQQQTIDAAENGKATENPYNIPVSEYADEEQVKAMNKAFQSLKAEVDSLRHTQKEYERSITEQKQSMAEARAKAEIIDEMVRVADHIPELKGIPNLREKLYAWKEKGVDDPKVQYFQDLFEIAKEKNVDLLTALEIDKGRKAEFVVAKAKDEGIKQAYNHPPNKSLSDIQGRNISTPEDYTEDEVLQMIKNHKVPEHWYTEDDRYNRKTIPKKHWKIFDLV